MKHSYYSTNKNLEELISLLKREGQPLELKRGEHFCQIGSRPTHMGIVESGIMKFSRPDSSGRERILSFAFAGDLVASYTSIASGTPAMLDVVAVESTTIRQLPLTLITSKLTPSLQVALSNCVARMALESLIEMSCLSHQERYEALVEQIPSIHNRMTNRTIASYLGITPESLCRLRRRLLTHG